MENPSGTYIVFGDVDYGLSHSKGVRIVMTFEDELDILLSMGKCFEHMRTCLEYKGNYNPKEKYHAGDICMIDGEVNVFTGAAWEVLGASPSYTPYTPKKIVYGTCKHCGAPLKNEVCEYCGVRNKA